MKTKRWMLAPLDRPRVRALAQEFGCAPLTAAVLAARGIDTVRAASAYLSTDPAGLHDPLLFADMDKAAALVERAIANKEHIVVYGDYDVDGITATCIMVDYLRYRGASCEYYIPNRLSEGYGLSRTAMEELYQRGARLMITVDSGITANEEIAIARDLGIQAVVTDHHECHEELPGAGAVVDCKRPDCHYPFGSLAGVGVAFKLICALEGDAQAMLDRYADLLALGTVADVMPIVGENRILVAAGLKKMAHTGNIGLEMLLREAGRACRRTVFNARSCAGAGTRRRPVRAEQAPPERGERDIDAGAHAAAHGIQPDGGQDHRPRGRGLASRRYRHRVLAPVRPLRLPRGAHRGRSGRHGQRLGPFGQGL